MSNKTEKRDVHVFVCGGERFVARLKNALPGERFMLSPCPLSSAARALGDAVRQDKGGVPRIIIADLSTDKAQGLQLCRDMVNMPEMSGIPLVAVIAENDFDTAELALAAGARDFIMKPFYKRNLAQKLEFLVYSCRGSEMLGGELKFQHDGYEFVTGLPGADLFRKLAVRKLEEALKAGGQAALLLINLDQFRRVKSILGKDVSDEILRRVAKAIETVVARFLGAAAAGGRRREGRLIGQNGQDEFLILISGIGAAHDIGELARAILLSVSKPEGTPDPKAYLTARIGITMAPADGNNIDRLIKNVESLAHYDGRQGKDSYRFYTSGMIKTVARRFELEAELSQGMHRGDLKIHYQPEVNLRTGEISGAEALVRWQHPQLGILAPEAFIAVAEDVGLITEIGEWVLRRACLQCAEWHKEGYGHLRISINISPYQFSRVNMIDLVKKALGDAALRPEYLTLEVTESLIIEDIEKTLASMLDLKRMGVRLALDDFGTGYSSLSYLHSMSVDFLKIDRAFVKELPGHAGGLAVTEAIARMAKALGLRITAEGVENLEQLQCLRGFGVDFYQGYYFSEPLPADEFAALLGASRGKLSAAGKFPE